VDTRPFVADQSAISPFLGGIRQRIFRFLKIEFSGQYPGSVLETEHDFGSFVMCRHCHCSGLVDVVTFFLSDQKKFREKNRTEIEK